MKTRFNSIVSYSIVLGALISINQVTAQSNLWTPIGKIGVGTLLPKASLEIRGTTLMQELTVTAGAIFKDNVQLERNLNVGGTTILNATNIAGSLKLRGTQPIKTISNEFQILLKDPLTNEVYNTTVNQLRGAIYTVGCTATVISTDKADETLVEIPVWQSKPSVIFAKCPLDLRIGIGTESPTHRLDVFGNENVSSTLEVGGVGNFKSDLNVGYNRVEGDFGKLSIKNTNSDAAIFLEQKNNTKGYERLIYSEFDNGLSEIFTARNGTATTGYDVYKLEASGKMTIRNATQKIFQLEPSGMLRTREMQVDLETNWPDYVFEKNYDLMPLSEVKTYIEKNKHLPNIPSATEVAAEGINLGEMSRVMMEKMEEMTLYILQQQEEIEKLKLKVNELEKRD